MIRDQLKIYAHNYRTYLPLLLITSLFFLGLKLYFVPVLEAEPLAIGFSLLAMNIIIGMTLKKTFLAIATGRAIFKSPAFVTLEICKIAILKATYSLIWLALIFWPYQPELMVDHVPGYVYVFCSAAVISTASAAFFRLFLWDILIYLGFAATMIWLNYDLQETRYFGLFFLFIAAYALISARQINQTTLQLIDKNLALKRAAQTARNASKAKTDFLAMISHEIRTPMNGILGMLDFLRETDLTKEQQDSLDVIGSCSNTLLNTLNDVIDLTKVEAGKLNIMPVDFDLRSTANSTARIFEPLANEKGLTFKVVLAPDIPRYINADPNRIQQVVINFLNNAVKFTDKGSITLRVSHVAKEINYIRFEVIDTGVGISDEDQKKLFLKFSQTDDGRTRSATGAGLGLAISKQLIFLMHGQIGVKSKKGQGTTFWFEIPYGEAEERKVVTAKREAAGDISPLKILIAEDNRINQMILEKSLSKNNHDITFVWNGREAIEAVQKQSFDIILMDVQMPEIDGITATRKIKALGAPHSNIPIVALTAFTQQSRTENCLQAGMVDCLSKPVNMAALNAILRKHAGAKTITPPRKEKPKPRPAEPDTEDNLTVLIEQFGMDYTRSFVGSVGTEIKRLINDMVQSMDRGDLQKVTMDAHDLKGLSGNIGLKQIYSLAADLEQGDNKITSDHWRIPISRLVLISAEELSSLNKKMDAMAAEEGSEDEDGGGNITKLRG